MSTYTPSTAEVKREFCEPRYEKYDRRKKIVRQAEARFDRWLAEHDAETLASVQPLVEGKQK